MPATLRTARDIDQRDRSLGDGGRVTEDELSPINTERLTPDEEALWQSMTRLVKLLQRQLHVDLQRDASVTIAEYDALRHLAQASDQQLRMSELARRVGLSPSRTTRLVESLQSQGFVTRVTSASDARGGLARLTNAGEAKVMSALPTYTETLRSHLFNCMEPSTVEIVVRALGTVPVPD
jgi:DNA-binding MarR family transcriptional regulator